MDAPHETKRPKLSDLAHEGVRLQPRRARRVRCSAWLASTVIQNSQNPPLRIRLESHHARNLRKPSERQTPGCQALELSRRAARERTHIRRHQMTTCEGQPQ